MEDLKPVSQWTDREISEQMVKLLYQQEKHQKYFSTVLTVYLVLTFIGVCAFIIGAVK